MSDLTLEETHIKEGVWYGRVCRSSVQSGIPQIEVTHLAEQIEGVTLSDIPDQPDCWLLQVPIPVNLLSDGAHSFVITDAKAQEKLGSFCIIAGEPLAESVTAEVELLREELELLKRAFRNHCRETSG